MPKDNYTAHQEVKAQAQLGSSTESKVILETTRTTSATMRMEHKTNFPDLPVTFSQRTQTPTIPLVSEGTMMDSGFKQTKSQTESTQTHLEPALKQQPAPFKAEPVFKPQQAPAALPSVPYPFGDVTDSAPSDPIKKNALDFFENNLKNLPALQDDRYTRFEDAMKSSKTYVHKQNEVKDQFQSKLCEDLTYFNLVPEPPPEMGFMPKVPKAQPERIVEKVKKLEEIHQTSDRPLSGTVFPQSFKREEKFEKKEFSSKSTISTSPFVQQNAASPLPRAYTPQINRDQLYTPDPTINRSASPKPSTDAVNMEKLWAMKPKSPEPFSVQNQQQNFSHEHKSSFVAYSTQQTHLFEQQSNLQEMLPPKECFVPIQPYSTEAPVQEELPKMSIKDTKSYFEQRIKQEEVKTLPTDLKAPGLVKQFAKPMVPLIPLDIEPGSPPEICYAPKPVNERKQSYVEKIEKTLEQNLDKEPERVPRGGVRLLPQRQTPQRTVPSESPQRMQQDPSSAPPMMVHAQMVPTYAQVVINPEPMSFQPPISTAEPLMPVFGEFHTKEMKSETFEIKKESSTGYRHVNPPSFLQQTKSSELAFMPPTQYDSPKPEPFKPAAPIVMQQPAPLMASPFVPQPAAFVPQPAPFVPQPAPFVPKQEPQQSREVPIQMHKPEQPRPTLQQHKPVSQQRPFVQATKQKFNEFVNEIQGSTTSLYKNFVRSEESTHSSESYFQKIEQSKGTPPQFMQEPSKQQFIPPQVRKKRFPDVML